MSPYLDGDAGILRYRGYPIEQLAEQSTYLEVAYLLIHGELPSQKENEQWVHDITYSHVHPRERAQAVPRGLPLRRPSDGHARLRGGGAVDVLPRRQGHPRPREPAQAGASADRQDADARRRRPPLQRRDAVRLPRQLASVRGELPVDDVEGGRAAVRRQPRSWPARSTCCSSSTPTTSRTARRPPCARSAPPMPIRTPAVQPRAPRSTGRATVAPTRPSSACSPRSGRSTTSTTSSSGVKQGERPAAGLRSPCLQELRPAGPHREADRRRGLRDHRQEPAARHRAQARRSGAVRRLLHLPQALPQRRLLLGPHLPGDGLSRSRCSPCCSPSPAPRVGWRTGSSCSSRTSASPVPASSTSVPEPRDYVPLDHR